MPLDVSWKDQSNNRGENPIREVGWVLNFNQGTGWKLQYSENGDGAWELT